MKKIKKLGIWMDHSHAFLLEFKNDSIDRNCIVSESILQEKENSLDIDHIHTDFNDLHKKKKQQRSKYYNKIIDIIRDFQQVILFGPTDAKNELLNLLEADPLFENIKIELKDTGKMTENQMHAFVIGHFK